MGCGLLQSGGDNGGDVVSWILASFLSLRDVDQSVAEIVRQTGRSYDGVFEPGLR